MAVYNTRSTRIHYSYVDKDNGLSYGFVDVEEFNHKANVNMNKFLRKVVYNKWNKVQYYGGDIYTIEFLEIEL